MVGGETLLMTLITKILGYVSQETMEEFKASSGEFRIIEKYYILLTIYIYICIFILYCFFYEK